MPDADEILPERASPGLVPEDACNPMGKFPLSVQTNISAKMYLMEVIYVLY
jgi:hypothetical protein